MFQSTKKGQSEEGRNMSPRHCLKLFHGTEFQWKTFYKLIISGKTMGAPESKLAEWVLRAWEKIL